jgi:hypothetical protein
MAWRAFLAALYGLPMDDEALAIYRACTGRSEAPTARAREAWLPIGRRGGKSRVLALVGAYEACFGGWGPYLSAGEPAYLPVVAADRKQGRAILTYLKALLLETELLAPLVVRETSEELELSNGVVVEIATSSYKTIRGRTIIAALLDEVAFWSSEDSANPDVEVVNALRPAMATIPGSLLLGASSPYAKRGVLWRAYRQHYAKPGPVLVWQADSKTMNPALPDHVIADAYEDDPVSAASEYGARFRDDIAAFITREAVEGCVSPGVLERPPVPHLRYFGFCDPSGGASDSMTLGIGHAAGKVAVLDVIREMQPPFSPDQVVADFAAALKAYRISRVEGDRYGGQWVVESFRTHGIAYVPSAKPKSDIYKNLLPMLNSGEVDLLDNSRLVAQLCGLERRTARGGRDSIDHAPGGHDDVCNAVAGAVTQVVLGYRPPVAASGIMRLTDHPHGSPLSQPFHGPRTRPPAWRVLPGSMFDDGSRYQRPRLPPEP